MSPTGRGVEGQPLEERRLCDVRRAVLPGIPVARRDRQQPPGVVAVEDRRVGPPEELGVDGAGDDRADLVRLGPDVGEEDRPPVAARPERLGRQVDVDPAGQREGDDERRRGEVARACQRMDPALEVAVPGQDRGDDQVVRLDRGGDRLVERPGVADAGRAAVAGQGEPERLERRHQPGRLEVAGHRARARRQRGLDRRLDAQAAGDRVAGKQTGPDHHGRVGRVGARRDRRDGDRAGADRVRSARRSRGRPAGRRARRPGAAAASTGSAGAATSSTASPATNDGGSDAGNEAAEASSTRPLPGTGILASEVAHVGLQPVREVRAEVLAQRLERDAVLRPARPGDGRRHARQVELEELVERRPVAGLAPQSLGLRVALDQLDPLG